MGTQQLQWRTTSPPIMKWHYLTKPKTSLCGLTPGNDITTVMPKRAQQEKSCLEYSSKDHRKKLKQIQQTVVSIVSILKWKIMTNDAFNS